MAEDFDLAIRIRALQDSSLIAKKLHNCPIKVCASPGFLKEYGPIDSPDDLVEIPAIMFNKHSNEGAWCFSSSNGSNSQIKLRKAMMTNTAEMMLQACLKGIGIAIIHIFPCHFALSEGKLVAILEEYQTTPQLDIMTVYKEKEYMPSRQRLLLDALAGFCKNCLGRVYTQIFMSHLGCHQYAYDYRFARLAFVIEALS